MVAGSFVIGLLLFFLKQTKLEGSLLYSAIDLLGLCWLMLSVFVALSVQTRRWHDLGYSGWMAVLSLIPILGIASFIWAGCVKGIRGPNKFGDDPLAALDDGTPNAGYELLSEATRLELSGRIAEALSAYERIANQYANTAVGTDAQRSAESLREKRK